MIDLIELHRERLAAATAALETAFAKALETYASATSISETELVYATKARLRGLRGDEELQASAFGVIEALASIKEALGASAPDQDLVDVPSPSKAAYEQASPAQAYDNDEIIF
jgi:hypothetical protein